MEEGGRGTGRETESSTESESISDLAPTTLLHSKPPPSSAIEAQLKMKRDVKILKDLACLNANWIHRDTKNKHHVRCECRFIQKDWIIQQCPDETMS